MKGKIEKWKTFAAVFGILFVIDVIVPDPVFLIDEIVLGALMVVPFILRKKVAFLAK